MGEGELVQGARHRGTRSTRMVPNQTNCLA